MRMRICFDLDGVIANITPDGNYVNATPVKSAILIINALHKQGHTIIISTARGFRSGKDWTHLTLLQLVEWGVEFDELDIGKKVGADYYIDDKAVSLEYLVRNVL